MISMAAMRAGKHVYCQKPLTHDVYEARMLAQAARQIKSPRRWASRGTPATTAPDLRVDRRADRRNP